MLAHCLTHIGPWARGYCTITPFSRAFFSKTLLTRNRHPLTCTVAAQMAELVDAPASGAGTRKGVEVRVLFWAPIHFLTVTDQ